jgi:hypothetical protein
MVGHFLGVRADLSSLVRALRGATFRTPPILNLFDINAIKVVTRSLRLHVVSELVN